MLTESPVNPLIAENLPYVPIGLSYFFAIPVLAILLYVIGYYSADNSTGKHCFLIIIIIYFFNGEVIKIVLGNPLQLLWRLNSQQASQGISLKTQFFFFVIIKYAALGTAVRTMVNILVLLVSSSGVILQLASNRYLRQY